MWIICILLVRLVWIEFGQTEKIYLLCVPVDVFQGTTLLLSLPLADGKSCFGFTTFIRLLSCGSWMRAIPVINCSYQRKCLWSDNLLCLLCLMTIFAMYSSYKTYFVSLVSVHSRWSTADSLTLKQNKMLKWKLDTHLDCVWLSVISMINSWSLKMY